MSIQIRRRKRSIELLLMLLFLLPLVSYSISCNDSRCRTGSCDNTGACICNLPDPSTILDGDRPFLGGRFCDEEQIMCDGTNSFWCEHGAKCNEIVQGEDYTCICAPGYSGNHCEHIGAPCGQIFCFHEAECVADSVVNSSARAAPHARIIDNKKWLAVFFTISCSLGALAAAVILAKKCFKKRETTRNSKFQHLSQMQMLGILDDDDDSEDDSLVPKIVHSDHAHL
ncbi:delta-like protein A [Cinnamomum micranthum f. kanehirae]|uniref:Delta-like protein A n=1 Tax=Cinnamomum micranthum f. kanehirae TaxID=337451 RepID=A0A3S3MZS6_9MAGN|nr:delta-like protein A [Cinnamomum micranthum f. kanehirae]